MFEYISTHFEWQDENMTLYNRKGKAVAYMENDVIWTFDGRAVAYLFQEAVYNFSGKTIRLV